MAKKYNVFESTNMGSTHYAERILDAVATTDIENGTFGYLDGQAEGERVIYNFVAGLKEGKTIVVADNPAWNETMVNGLYRSDRNRSNYVNEAGVPFRVRVVKLGDDFATAIEGVTEATRANMKKGTYVTIDATTGKLVAADMTAEDATVPTGAMVGHVEDVRMVGAKLITSAHNYGSAYEMFRVKIESLDRATSVC